MLRFVIWIAFLFVTACGVETAETEPACGGVGGMGGNAAEPAATPQLECRKCAVNETHRTCMCREPGGKWESRTFPRN